MLFSYYGLRLKDVQNLKFDNIHWKENKILLVQSKDREPNVIKISSDMRYALLDYIKNERKKDAEYLFVTKSGKKISSGGYFNIVNTAFKNAGINTANKHHGSHSLRHSLATSLLMQKNGIKEIATILGHNNIQTTKIYTKVNLRELKKLSLEVPIWKI